MNLTYALNNGPALNGSPKQDFKMHSQLLVIKNII